MNNYFSTFQQIRKYLTKSINVTDEYSLFSKYKVFYLPASTPNHVRLRIEELSEGILGTSFMAKSRPIGSIDLEVDKQKSIVDITFWMINKRLNQSTNKLYDPPLPDDQAQAVKEILIEFAESIARENNINLLKRDVHQSLKEFNSDIKQFGFELNGEKADNNPYWLKSFKQLN